MIDAIRTSLRGATAMRAEALQPALRSAQQDAGPREHDQAEPESPRYYSPVVRLDSEAQRIVLQYRDTNTGNVIMQYPSEKQLEAYRSRGAAAKPQDEQEGAEAVAGQGPAAATRRPGETPRSQREGSAQSIRQQPDQPASSFNAEQSFSAPSESRAAVPASRPRLTAVTV